MRMIWAAVAAAALTGSAAQAAIFRFSYAADFGTVTGRLTGNLQGDGNTILVDGVDDFVRLNGVALPSFPFVTTGSTIYGETTPPTVTFDGSILELFACTAEFCDGDGFGFDPLVVAFRPVFRFYVPALVPELIEEDLDARRWTLTAVPEPASWSLMMAGFAAVGLAVRRRKRGVLAA